MNALVVVLAALGGVFIFLTRSRVHESSNVLAAYWIGILLVTIAAAVFLFFEDTAIRVDHSIRSLLILKTGRFTKRSIIVPFEEVAAVQVSTVGHRPADWVTYHLVIRLKNGKKETPGRFSTDQNEIVEVAQRLAQDVGCECVVGRRPSRGFRTFFRF